MPVGAHHASQSKGERGLVKDGAARSFAELAARGRSLPTAEGSLADGDGRSLETRGYFFRLLS
jgi:hypothetical protein